MSLICLFRSTNKKYAIFNTIWYVPCPHRFFELRIPLFDCIFGFFVRCMQASWCVCVCALCLGLNSFLLSVECLRNNKNRYEPMSIIGLQNERTMETARVKHNTKMFTMQFSCGRLTI